MSNYRLSSISRRDSIAFGTLASFGMARLSESLCQASTASSFGRARRCVVIWLDGGPSHLETFDPKPEAPAEVRGPLGVVRTMHPGEVFGEGLPQLAKRADQFSIIRSMTSPVGEHNLATQYALSGHIPGGRAAAPAFLLPASRELRRARPLPAHVAIPHFDMGGGSKLQGFLDTSYLPWSLGVEPTDNDFVDRVWPAQAGLDSQRLARRRSLLSSVGPESSALADSLDLLQDTEARGAFELQRESAATRARYGGKAVGQNCLLARRLLEAGVPMITINNQGWDTHARLHERLHAGYTGARVPVGLIPSLDLAVSALLDDLRSSGLIDETLVVVMGEFGRTPKINTLGGRDHWPRAYSVLVSGGGILPGTIYGSSDRVGENAADSPVTPSDLVATFYHLLGLDPHQRVTTPDGQQLSRVPEEATVVSGVLEHS